MDEREQDDKKRLVELMAKLRERRPLSTMTEPELQDYFNFLATMISVMLPPMSTGDAKPCRFILLVADDPGAAQYVSNGEREDCIKWMKETIERFERRDVIPR